MNITDEQLSAFLDGELPEAEMEIIRNAIMADEDLADRLAELAMVDEVVAASYATIDTRPVPESINAFLSEEPLVVASTIQDAEATTIKKSKPETAKIIAFPMMQKFQNILQKQMAIAASVVMIIGLGAVQLLHESNSSGNWNNIAKVLDTAPSGIVQASSNGVEIKPRLTFINKDGNYCRQFDMTDKQTATENIACHKDNKWQLTVSLTLDKVQQENNYQPASGGSLLDSTIDQMADGEFFDASAEAKAIGQHWSSKK